MIKPKPSISFYTLGCRLNQSETAVIQRTFEIDGYNIVDYRSPADVVVINTCTVTENGDADTRRLVRKVSRINPQTRIALIGCQAQVQKEKLTELPNVQWVIGNAKKMDVKSIVEKIKDPHSPSVITPTIPRESFTMPVAGINQKHTRANLKIQDGCDFFCSFCEIPYARGRARSRQFDDLVLEARALVNAGHKELVLTGINIGTYKDGNHEIRDVLDTLEKIEGLKRIRISSIEPTTIPWEMINRMGQGKLCRYLHIPLQSGSDPILKSMKRKYTTKEFNEFICKISDTVTDICIGTDVIVGFPGETEDDFSKTEELLRKMPIHYFHVFSYSQRSMAKSQDFKSKVPTSKIQERSQILRELSQRKRTLYYKTRLGSTEDVLFEEKKDGYWSGVTDHYVRVHVASTKNLTNTIYPVKLTTVENNIVMGRL